MTDKKKQAIVITVCLSLSAVLVYLIAQEFKTEPLPPQTIPTPESSSVEIYIDSSYTKPSSKADDEVNYEIADDKGVEQTIQPDVEPKPEYTDEELSNPEQSPDGTVVEPPTEENPNPPQTQDPVVTAPTTSAPTVPPGFEGVTSGGPNTQTIVDSDGDINKQVGAMG